MASLKHKCNSCGYRAKSNENHCALRFMELRQEYVKKVYIPLQQAWTAKNNSFAPLPPAFEETGQEHRYSYNHKTFEAPEKCPYLLEFLFEER